MQAIALGASILAALVVWTAADAPQPSGSAAASAAASPDASTASPSPSMPAAIDIYADAIREMRMLEARGNPPYLVYDLEIDSHNLHWYPNVDDGYADWDVKFVHANETTNYRVWYRSADQRALVQDAATHQAYVGDAPFEPETDHMLDESRQGRGASPSPSPASDASSTSSASGQVLGAITVNGSSHYEVTLIGLEQRDGHPVYHLHLRAIRDAVDYPLTDLWVDAADYRVRAVHGEVTIRAVAAAIGVGVSAEFASLGDYWLVSSIDFTMKGYVMLWHANTAASLRTHILSAPASLPAEYFMAHP